MELTLTVFGRVFFLTLGAVAQAVNEPEAEPEERVSAAYTQAELAEHGRHWDDELHAQPPIGFGVPR